MRQSSIWLLVAVCILGGCKNSLQTSLIPPFVSFSKSSQFGYLVAGGTKWPGILRDTVDGIDSFVHFDFHRSITVTNTSGAPQHLKAAWGIFKDSLTHVIPPSKQTATIPGLVWKSDVLDLGTLQPNSSVVMDTANIVRINQTLAHTLLSYQLLIGTVNDSLTQGVSALFDSVPFASRYRGYIYTVESSPDPINTLDGPDDGDWQGSASFQIKAANPNPVGGFTSYTEFNFIASQPVDSVQLDLHITPGSIVRSYSQAKPFDIGAWSMKLDLSGLTPGLYRLMITAWQGTTVTHSHGDIRVQ